MTLSRTTLRMNKWLQRRFWWWIGPALAVGIWLGGRVHGWW